MSQCQCARLKERIARLRQALRDAGLDLQTIMKLEYGQPQEVETSFDNGPRS